MKTTIKTIVIVIAAAISFNAAAAPKADKGQSAAMHSMQRADMNSRNAAYSNGAQSPASLAAHDAAVSAHQNYA
ncbi:UNVERIFIED_CONTAM: hypothetical protein RF648_19045, partial [Kocuria sp. CPCC 205274]